MDTSPRSLRKPDVEALLGAVADPSASVLEEIAVVRNALIPALRRVLRRDGDAPWAALIASASQVGQWQPTRGALLAAADTADAAIDAEAVLDALWDLVTELNEVRTIKP